MTDAQKESFVESQNDISEKSKEVLDTIKRLGKCTYHRLCEELPFQMNTITSRLHDLESEGYIRICGKEYNIITNRYNSVYEALDIPIKPRKYIRFKPHSFSEKEATDILDRKDIHTEGYSVSFDKDTGIAKLTFSDLTIEGIFHIARNTDNNLVFISQSSSAIIPVRPNRTEGL